MEIYGRKLLDRNTKMPIDFDDLVFLVGGKEIVISTYSARTDGKIELRCNDGVIVVLPRAANVVQIETRR